MIDFFEMGKVGANSSKEEIGYSHPNTKTGKIGGRFKQWDNRMTNPKFVTGN